MVKHHSPAILFKARADSEPTNEEKHKEETKMIRIFDGSASCIKNYSPGIALKPLEERREVPVFGEDNVGPKIAAIF